MISSVSAVGNLGGGEEVADTVKCYSSRKKGEKKRKTGRTFRERLESKGPQTKHFKRFYRSRMEQASLGGGGGGNGGSAGGG